MKPRIFITATNTDIGKTYTTKLILKELASRGIRVGVIKPIETGVVDGYAPDGEELLKCVRELNSEFDNFEVKDIVPITHTLASAPFIASDATPLNIQKIEIAIKKIERVCDVLVIEGAGGLYVPIDEEFMMIDVISILKAKAILVTHCSLGCINDTILSKKALQERNIPYLVAFNCRQEDESFSTISEPYFTQTDFKVLKVSEDMKEISDFIL